MKLISIFYFINCRLVITSNAGFGALNVALTGIQIRDFPVILSREAGEGLIPSHTWRNSGEATKQPDFGGKFEFGRLIE